MPEERRSRGAWLARGESRKLADWRAMVELLEAGAVSLVSLAQGV